MVPVNVAEETWKTNYMFIGPMMILLKSWGGSNLFGYLNHLLLMNDVMATISTLKGDANTSGHRFD